MSLFVKYYFGKNKEIFLCTTIGQLNFFKWLFENGIIHYVIYNYDLLLKEMGNNNKAIKKVKQPEKMIRKFKEEIIIPSEVKEIPKTQLEDIPSPKISNCTFCGSKLSDEALFCPQCGNKIKE